MSLRKDHPRLVPARPSAEDRLYSWKEIAVYLGREQRTVQRWERSESLPVHRLQHGKAGSVFALKSELDVWMAQHSGEPPVRRPAAAKPGGARIWAGAAAGIVLLAAAVEFVLPRGAREPSAGAPVPFTSDPGTELEARISPNGTQVAYVWNGETGDNFDIYVRMLLGGEPLRITTDAAHDYSPTWSPDGASIAFLRRTGGATAMLFVVSALGGAERKVAEFSAAAWPQWQRPGPFLTWSPDGRWLVASGSQGTPWRDALLRISPATGEARPLTLPPPKSMGDMAPAFSPNGRTLAFSRLLSWGRSELWLLPLSQEGLPAGEARKFETRSTWNSSPAWLPDGRGLLFSTGSMDAPHLARIDVGASEAARPLRGEGEYGWMPSLARAPDGRVRLVYTQHFESVNIWRTPVDGSGPGVGLITSAHWSYEPAWSPEGKRVAFLSDRTGHGEIWVADADGRQARQWTFLKQDRLGSPRWSPDGRRIAFTAPGAQGSFICLIDAPGATPRPVPGSERCGYLEWALDGRAIYFSSNRGTGVEIWNIPADGGTAVQVTHQGGRVPAISSDGRYLYYLRMADNDGRNDLWRLPLGGGQEENVLKFVDAYSVGDTGIAFKYYRPGQPPAGPYLEFFRFATGEIERLPGSSRPLRYGIALSRDGRHLLHGQSDYEVSDLMLVENFR